MNQVKANEPLVPDSEASNGVNHLHEEPKNQRPLLDGVLSFKEENTEFSGIEDFTCEVKYGSRDDSDLCSVQGGMASHITQVEDGLNLGALDGILDEIDEVEDLDCANGLSGLCKDYFLDIDLAQEVSALNHGPGDGFCFVNSSSDSHSPGYSGSSNGCFGTSEMSTVTAAPEIKCKVELCKRLGRCACSRDLGKISELEKDVDFLVPESSEENKKSSSIPGRVAVNDREKRQRKPPQRYIEESSKANSRNGQKQTSVVAKDRPLLRAQPKKKCKRLLESESEDNSSASGSEDELMEKKSIKNVDRRKHQRMWTVQEVAKLIDGICEFGVGHWTDIKRLSFASSAYRTPIDLRDKWRNLLKASNAQQPQKREAEQKESAGRPLPRFLLRRVRELAALHPYPRKTKTRSSFFPRSS